MNENLSEEDLLTLYDAVDSIVNNQEKSNVSEEIGDSIGALGDLGISDETIEEETDLAEKTEDVPEIVEQPENAEVILGKNAVFKVKVEGGDVNGYQWQESADGGVTWSDLDKKVMVTAGEKNLRIKVKEERNKNLYINVMKKIVCYGDSNTYGWDPRFFVRVG